MQTVPQTETGRQGLSSCCKAPVTFSESTLCCKRCYQKVTPLALQGKASGQFDRVVDAWIKEVLTWEDVAVFQDALLTGTEQPTAPLGHVISVEAIEAAAKGADGTS